MLVLQSSCSSMQEFYSSALALIFPRHRPTPSWPSCRAFSRHSFRKTIIHSLRTPSEFPLSPSTASHHKLSAVAEFQQLLEEKEEERFSTDGFLFKDSSAEPSSDFPQLSSSPHCQVKELEELPEQWRRSRLAWLCKELSSHKPATLIRILNGQRKWITQDDCTYLAVHFMRIRENESSFRVYKWMVQQHWFLFDFALATKLAEYLGKDRKFSKCREIFDQIINQGQVPSESTFHILTVAYLSAPIQGCLEEACSIYNRMIQLGGCKPPLSLHNSLFKALTLVNKPGDSSKNYLKQAEFIYHNLVTSECQIHKDVYAGLIWLHSYQDVIDKERIATLRAGMQQAGMDEGKDVLLSIMRTCAKEGDVEEAEKTWVKLLESGTRLPSQAFVYRMEVHAEAGEHMKSLEIFRAIQQQVPSTSVIAYHKIIEVMSKAKEVELTETLMIEFIESGLKPLMPSFVDIMDMYLNLSLHDKLELAFSQCLLKCHPNRTIYRIYMDSLVRISDLDKAEEIFNDMHKNGVIGLDSRSCNIILQGYLDSGQYVKAEKIHDMMCQKKYDIDPSLVEKIEYVLSLNRKAVKEPIRLKLDKEQREILIGLLLGGVRTVFDEERRNHAIHFIFNEKSEVHFSLRVHIHEFYHEWLTSFRRMGDQDFEIPYQFFTVPDSAFGFFADQFWPKARPMVPKLIHRWLSARVLAYWYMYGGHRTSSGDIVLKLKAVKREDLERVVKALRTKSLECRVKRKGQVFCIGFRGRDALCFWELTEPYILDQVKDNLKVDQTLINDATQSQGIGFDAISDSDDRLPNFSEGTSHVGGFQSKSELVIREQS